MKGATITISFCRYGLGCHPGLHTVTISVRLRPAPAPACHTCPVWVSAILLLLLDALTALHVLFFSYLLRFFRLRFFDPTCLPYAAPTNISYLNFSVHFFLFLLYLFLYHSCHIYYFSL